jgi:hypothetical protein
MNISIIVINIQALLLRSVPIMILLVTGAIVSLVSKLVLQVH